MTSSSIEKIRKSWETYSNTVREWIQTGKYEEWQFADNLITDFQTYLVAYNNERNKLSTQAKATKKSYLKKENITRRLLNQTIVYKRTTISKIAKTLDITSKETRRLLKTDNLIGTELWDKLLAATGEDYDEASYWYSTFIPTDTIRTKRGENQLEREDVLKLVFGDVYGKQAT